MMVLGGHTEEVVDHISETTNRICVENNNIIVILKMILNKT